MNQEVKPFKSWQVALIFITYLFGGIGLAFVVTSFIPMHQNEVAEVVGYYTGKINSSEQVLTEDLYACLVQTTDKQFNDGLKVLESALPCKFKVGDKVLVQFKKGEDIAKKVLVV